jgi:hypothetical protein
LRLDRFQAPRVPAAGHGAQRMMKRIQHRFQCVAARANRMSPMHFSLTHTWFLKPDAQLLIPLALSLRVCVAMMQDEIPD